MVANLSNHFHPRESTVHELTIAVVGATGAVGTQFLSILEKRYEKLPNIKLLASSRSAGKVITVGGREIVVQETTEGSFRDVDIAFIRVPTEVSRKLAPQAVAEGAVVIDDSSAFRMDESVPLVVPEVNGQDVEWHNGLIANPNCSTTPLVMLCHPLRGHNPIVRIGADTRQSVSGAGATTTSSGSTSTPVSGSTSRTGRCRERASATSLCCRLSSASTRSRVPGASAPSSTRGSLADKSHFDEIYVCGDRSALT